MSEPTKEAVELARQLYELGYEQMVGKGDWYVWWHKHLVLWNGAIPRDDFHRGSFFSIPSLTDGLRFLRERQFEYQLKPRLDSYALKKGWTCQLKIKHYVEKNYGAGYNGNNEQELILKAMVYVMKEEASE